MQTFDPYDIVGWPRGPCQDLWQESYPQRCSHYKASSGVEAPRKTLVILRTPLFGPSSKDEGEASGRGPMICCKIDAVVCFFFFFFFFLAALRGVWDFSSSTRD